MADRTSRESVLADTANLPAFPQSVSIGPAGDVYNSFDVVGASGLTIRELFAMAVLPWCLTEFDGGTDDAAGAAVQIADSLIAALQPKEPRHGG